MILPLLGKHDAASGTGRSGKANRPLKYHTDTSVNRDYAARGGFPAETTLFHLGGEELRKKEGGDFAPGGALAFEHILQRFADHGIAERHERDEQER